MNSSTPLTRDRIADTTLWRLILRIDPRRLSALLTGPESVQRPVIFHTEELADDSLKALENAIYDNQLLLSDFKRIDIIFSSPLLLTAPDGTDSLHEAMAAAMLPDYAAPRTILSESFGAGSVVYAPDSATVNFASRTFAAARLHHALAVNATYLTHRNRDKGLPGTTYALCEAPGEMTLVGFDAAGSLRYINRPSPREAADYAYYCLAGPGTGSSTMVGGEPELRNEVCDILRRMQPGAKILPLTLPEELLHLRRMAPGATFDMLFLTQL